MSSVLQSSNGERGKSTHIMLAYRLISPYTFFKNQNKVHTSWNTKMMKKTVALSKMGLMSTLSTVQWAESV